MPTEFASEVTWFAGVGLLLVTMGSRIYPATSCPGIRAYWATIVGTRIAGVAPVIGDPLLRIMRGGDAVSAVTLARFFGTHVWVLPTILLLYFGFHMYLVIRLGISAVPKRDE